MYVDYTPEQRELSAELRAYFTELMTPERLAGCRGMEGGATYREAAFSADVGAEAGASVIAADYNGELRLDVPRAELAAVESALAARSRPGRSASATANPTLVCVTITDEYQPRILSAVGVGPTTVSVEACAAPRRG